MSYYLAVSLLLVLLFVLWCCLEPTYSKTEPQAIPHSIPFLGHARYWAQHRREFFEWGNRQSKNRPFTIYIAGQKHYVFGRPSDVSTIFRKSKTLTIKPLIDLIRRYYFRIEEKGIDALREAGSEIHAGYAKHLLQPENYNVVVGRYFDSLLSRLEALREKTKISGYVDIDLVDLVRDTMSDASLDAYFGPELLRQDPHYSRDMVDFFVKGFWPAMSGLPELFWREGSSARKRMEAAMRKCLDSDGVIDGASGHIKEQMKLLKPLLSEDAQVANQVSFTFAIITNSLPTTYNLLVRTLPRSEVIAELKDELQRSDISKMSPRDMHTMILSQLPLHKSCLWESIRLATVAASLRMVVEDTEVDTRATETDGPHMYTLEKGSLVNMPASILHFNPKINPDPENFHPKRFLSKELGGEGQSINTSTRPFGGGTSYCPGRRFAEYQVVGLVALLLQSFDVEILNDGWTIPATNELDDVFNAEHMILRLRSARV